MYFFIEILKSACNCNIELVQLVRIITSDNMPSTDLVKYVFKKR